MNILKNFGIEEHAVEYKVGDRVEILRQDVRCLQSTKDKRGTIVNIDGYYIDVRPNRQKCVIELYPNEIRFLARLERKIEK